MRAQLAALDDGQPRQALQRGQQAQAQAARLAEVAQGHHMLAVVDADAARPAAAPAQASGQRCQITPGF